VSRRSVLLGLVLVAVAGSVSLLRQLVAGDLLDTLSAEDGAVFLEGARNDGVRSFLTMYGGYLHPLPRFVAFISTPLPLPWMSALFASVAAVWTGACAAMIYALASRLVASRCWRVLPAASVVLMPTLTGEGLNNIAYMQWPLFCAVAWLAVVPARALVRPRAAFALGSVSALSSPFLVFLAPLVLVHRSAWKNHPVVRGALLGLAVHLPLIALNRGRSLEGADRDLRRAIARGGSALLTWEYHSVVIGAALLALAAVVVWRSERRQARVMLAAGCLTYGGLVALQGAHIRYGYPLGVMVASSIALAEPTLAARGPALLLLGALMIGWIVDFPASGGRISGPSWRASARALERECAAGAQIAEAEVSPAGTTIRIRC
jgi:hypothetical protein